MQLGRRPYGIDKQEVFPCMHPRRRSSDYGMAAIDALETGQRLAWY